MYLKNHVKRGLRHFQLIMCVCASQAGNLWSETTDYLGLLYVTMCSTEKTKTKKRRILSEHQLCG